MVGFWTRVFFTSLILGAVSGTLADSCSNDRLKSILSCIIGILLITLILSMLGFIWSV